MAWSPLPVTLCSTPRLELRAALPGGATAGVSVMVSAPHAAKANAEGTRSSRRRGGSADRGFWSTRLPVGGHECMIAIHRPPALRWRPPAVSSPPRVGDGYAQAAGPPFVIGFERAGHRTDHATTPSRLPGDSRCVARRDG